MSRMNRLIPLEKDYYLDHDDFGGGNRSEEDEDSGSSEDEVQRMFADIAGVQLPSQQRRERKHDKSFEAEMEDELNESFRQHNAEWSGGKSLDTAAIAPSNRGKSKASSSKTNESRPTTADGKKKLRKDDEIDPALGLNDRGTDSDEEFQKNEGIEGDDDDDDEKLMYDPEEDEANQVWVDSHRQSYQPKATKVRPLPKSDAVLNCPACMSVLCLDCQRHEVYKTQYRAMFVRNCQVKRDELLYQPKSRKRGGKRNRTDDDLASTLKSGERVNTVEDAQAAEDVKKNVHPDDIFHPVICSVCKTEVAVHDSDEVYHFFNTLASYS